MRYLVLSIGLWTCFALGCSKPAAPEKEPEVRTPEGYGRLPGLSQVPHQGLQDELARIVEEGGTPEQLSQTTVPPADNVAMGLLELFPEKRVGSIARAAEERFPPGPFQLNPVELQKAVNFYKKYDKEQLEARQALQRPQCDFGIQFLAGNTAEMKFVRVVWLLGRLEAFRAADALNQGDIDGAIEALSFILRLAQCMAAEKCVEPRLEAAYLRTKAFTILQAIVRNRGLQQSHLDKLYHLVEQQLKTWPSDAQAWIGDRAMGMHAYEMVREGNLLELLTQEEMTQFTEERVIGQLAEAARRNVDKDELFYLQAMRQIIDSCAKPYWQRIEIFEAIDQQLQTNRNDSDFPLVAARLLLPNIQAAQAIQAQDRANWEAWLLALAAATNREPPPYEKNPLTGKSYRVNKLDHQVLVEQIGSAEEGSPTVFIPLPEAAQPSSSQAVAPMPSSEPTLEPSSRPYSPPGASSPSASPHAISPPPGTALPSDALPMAPFPPGAGQDRMALEPGAAEASDRLP